MPAIESSDVNKARSSEAKPTLKAKAKATAIKAKDSQGYQTSLGQTGRHSYENLYSPDYVTSGSEKRKPI